ncbi:MAG: helix-turn-helix domain-containing protein [Huintestinicola sp.]
MNTDFPRIITLLRKERNISQKQAAADLGVSQALLSHYEKGIRECGLDFLVKTADYYGVSCDYLLGRCAEPAGRAAAESTASPSENVSRREEVDSADIQASNQAKKMLFDSQQLIFALLGKCRSSSLENEVIRYLSLAAYRIFRVLYSANPRNDRRFFTVDEPSADGFTLAAMEMSKARAQSAAQSGEMQSVQLTTNILSEQFPEYAPALLNAVKKCESDVKAASGDKKSE